MTVPSAWPRRSGRYGQAVSYGYRLGRPDPSGHLFPVTATGFDADMFACPVLEDARS